MNKPSRILCFLSLFVLSLYIVPAECRFERGDRYWNGKPQPIGIDFSFNNAIAVYADGPDKFTTIGVVSPNPDNNYAQYIYALYKERNIWGSSSIVNDDEDFVLDDDLHDDWDGTLWYHDVLSRVQEQLAGFTRYSCRRLFPIFGESDKFLKTCFPEEHYTYEPSKPRSRFQTLLSERRIRRLRAMMPKWFRSPQPAVRLSRSGFVLSVFEMLEEIKQAGFQNNVTIKSATISRPDWVFNDFSDLIDEACLLADIEVYEQPRNQFKAAAKTAPEGGSILILNHGVYHSDAFYGIWDGQEKAYRQTEAMGLQNPGMSYLSYQLTYHVLRTYNANANVSEGERSWALNVGLQHVNQEVFKARERIKSGTDWPHSVNMVGQDQTINLTEPSGRLRSVNVTRQDVLDVEAHYINETSKMIRTLLESWTAELANLKTPSNLEHNDEIEFSRTGGQADLSSSLPDIPRLKPVNTTIILDTGHNIDILQRAVEQVLGFNGSDTTQVDNGICMPQWAIAARGAALRARDWITYYEASFPESWQDEEYERDFDLDE